MKKIIFLTMLILMSSFVSAGTILFDDFENTTVTANLWNTNTGSVQSDFVIDGTGTYRINSGQELAITNISIDTLIWKWEMYLNGTTCGSGNDAPTFINIRDSGDVRHSSMEGRNIEGIGGGSALEVFDGGTWQQISNSSFLNEILNVKWTFYNANNSCDVETQNGAFNTNLVDCRQSSSSANPIAKTRFQFQQCDYFIDNVTICENECDVPFIPPEPISNINITLLHPEEHVANKTINFSEIYHYNIDEVASNLTECNLYTNESGTFEKKSTGHIPMLGNGTITVNPGSWFHTENMTDNNLATFARTNDVLTNMKITVNTSNFNLNEPNIDINVQLPAGGDWLNVSCQNYTHGSNYVNIYAAFCSASEIFGNFSIPNDCITGDSYMLTIKSCNGAGTTVDEITLNNTFIHHVTNEVQNASWNVGCTNSSPTTDRIIFAPTNRTFTVDITDPQLSSTIFKNLSVFLNNLTGEFSFTDNFLIHSVNFSINGVDDVFVNENINLVNFNVNISKDISGLSAGQHNLILKFADGHTAKKLKAPKSYHSKNGIFNDYMEYEFNEPYNMGSIKIKQKGGSIFDNWETKERYDRHQFSFRPHFKKSSYTFEIKSDNIIYIIEDENIKYKQWLIYEGHWLDFMPYTNVTFTRITDTKVEVTIYGIDPNKEEIVFDSIGDLNVVQINYTFTVIKVTENFVSPLLQTVTENTELTLDILNPVNITQVLLQWNNTNFTADVLITNDSIIRYNVSLNDYNNQSQFHLNNTVTSVNVAHRWWINFTNTTEYDMTDLQNQTVLISSIDNCSIFTNKTINFTVRRDDLETFISSDVEAYVELSQLDSGLKTQFNLTWGGITNFSMCLNSPDQEFNIFSQLKYQDVNKSFNEEIYYINNVTVSNQTQLVDLYLTPGASTITFTVLDQDENEVDDVFIHILRYDFGTNTHRTTEILKTGSDGTALGNVVLITEWYKFFLFKDGILLFESEPVKLTTTSRTFRIDLTNNKFNLISGLNDIQSSLTFTNETSNFAYTFTNPTGTSVTGCLNVIEKSIQGQTLINETCVTASSATILVNIGTDTVDKTYIAKGTLKINPTWADSFMTVSFDEGFAKWGKDGIFITFMMKMAMALIGIWSPAVAIVMIGITDMMMVGMGLVGMNWTFFVTYLILGMIVIIRVSRR